MRMTLNGQHKTRRDPALRLGAVKVALALGAALLR